MMSGNQLEISEYIRKYPGRQVDGRAAGWAAGRPIESDTSDVVGEPPQITQPAPYQTQLGYLSLVLTIFSSYSYHKVLYIS